MRRLVIPLALSALCLSGCQTGADTSAVAAGVSAVSTSPTTTTPPVALDPSESPTPSPTSTPTPVRVISPDLRTKYACSVAAGKFPTMKKGVRFTAQVRVVNRGNIGASVLLKATWTASAEVRRAEKLSVGYGKTVKVTFNAPTTAREVTAFRGNRGHRCLATAKVLAFVGKPRPVN